MKTKLIYLAVTVLFTLQITAQEPEDQNQQSNIQTYTPSVLLNKGQWDIKFFNNLYTETEQRFNGVKTDKARETYFTSTLDIFTGISDNNRLNIGLLLEYRSNAINGQSATSVFKFANNSSARHSLSSFAPALKWQPIEGIGNFSYNLHFIFL
jgi:hypothetical protein